MDLNVGAIVALSKSPVVAPFLAEFAQWGPGKYDARHHVFDGTNLRVLHEPSIPVVIPPAYGLLHVGFETYTGDGPIPYWNGYVGVTQMGGHGDFSDPRIGLTVTQTPDEVTAKLPALLAYQLSLTAPPPPPGTFDAAAAARGKDVFNDSTLGLGRCSRCHIAPTYTDVLSGSDPKVPLLHTAAEIGADPEYPMRSATGMYRTTPLRGLWQHAPYFHDGRAADLNAVVDHYEARFMLNLGAQRRADLVEFLKSL
jgi:cytochrome c peroxidase